jgi:hypothetical protein
MWTDAAFSIGGHRVTLSIELVGPARRDAIATSVAWLACVSCAPGDAINSTIWKTLAEDILGPHIAFSIDHDDPESLGWPFWSEAMKRATSAFIRVNKLEDSILRSLTSLQAGDERTVQ